MFCFALVFELVPNKTFLTGIGIYVNIDLTEFFGKG
jgi:hypothetical protein